MEDHILELTDICMRHGSKWVLKGFNLKIQKGIIYSLLGPSGAGKTTIFGIILRQILPQYGKVQLNINSRKDFGYMPQKLSLFDDLSLQETLTFYSYILGFDGEIPEKTNDLLDRLELRCFDSVVSYLSGGEKRRLSFVIALMNEAKFLLLDEPTASLDCLHSRTIWNYLISLSNNGTTVLLTTHYVQEAANSTTVGFLRKGTLIEEGVPSELVKKYNTEDMEQIFLNLSSAQDQEEDLQEQKEFTKSKFEPITGFSGDQNFKMSSFKGQMLKNYIWARRNLFVILAHLCIPIFFALFYGVAYGNEPGGLKIAILSQARSENCFNQTNAYNDRLRCDIPLHLECFIYSRLEKKFKLVHYENLTEAELDLNRTMVSGILIIDKNFTLSITEFWSDVTSFKNDLVQGAIIQSSVENYDYVINSFAKKEIGSSVYGIFEDIENHCNTSSKAKPLPIRYEEAVYGDNDDTAYAHTVYPSYLCAITFAYTIIFTTPVLLTEKKEGFFQRNMIAGLTYFEMVTAHIIVQSILMVCQDILFFLLLIIPFNYPLAGNFFVGLSVLICCNLTGVSLAIMISEVFNEEIIILMSSVGLMNSSVLLGGVLWPIAAFPRYLQIACYFFPTAKMSDSMTAVTVKGLGPTNSEVYKSYVECLIWVSISVVVCSYCFKRNKAIFG